MENIRRPIKTKERIEGWMAGVGAFVVYLLIALAFLHGKGYDPAALVHAGKMFFPNDRGNTLIPVADTGYDGQFFYRLALDPFVRDESMVPTLDKPAYRHQRILYPSLAHIISGGNVSLVPWSLLFVNLAATAFLGWAGLSMAKTLGAHPCWGLALTFYPGFLFSVLHDLAEPMAGLFVVCGLLSLRLERIRLAGLWLALAVWTRETTLIVPISVFIASLWEPGAGRSRPMVYAGIIPISAWIALQLLLYAKWGVFPMTQGMGNLGAPFYGIIHHTLDLVSGSLDLKKIVDILLLTGFASLLVMAAIGTRSKNVKNHEKLAFWSYCLIAMCFTDQIWEYRGGFMRALSEFYVIGALLTLASRPKYYPMLFGFWMILFSGVTFGYLR